MLRLWVQWWQWMMITSCIYSNKMQSIALFLFHFFPSVLLITYLHCLLLQFLFEAATAHCVDLATDRHGCCVLQKCLQHSGGEQKHRLISEITSNALLLSQDPFGLDWSYLFFLAVLEYFVTVISCFHALRIESFWQPFCCSNQAGPSCPRPISGEWNPC